MNYLKIVTIFLAGLLFFCAGPSQVQRETRNQTKEEAEQFRMNEDFEPTSLGDYTIAVPEPEVSKKDVVDIESILRGSETPDTLDVGHKVPGYRVQLIATRDESEARAVLREAVLSFEEQVYRTFDDPYYKIRVGDCTSRFEADELQQKAAERGFLESWVVQTMVWQGPPPDSQAKPADEKSR